jgi:holliday junction DNA helicase RuvA
VIHALSGTLTEVAPQSPQGAYVLLNWQGLTWQAFTTQPCIAMLPTVGQEAQLFTSLVIREAGTHLFGFASRERRDLFNLLLLASGVGPKMALSLLDSLSVAEVVQAVASGHYKTLTTAKGVGPKLAQKLVIELKDTMLKWRNLPTTHTMAIADMPSGPAFADAESVLLSLGYTQAEITRSFDGIAAEETQAEMILQTALRQLARLS